VRAALALPPDPALEAQIQADERERQQDEAWLAAETAASTRPRSEDLQTGTSEPSQAGSASRESLTLPADLSEPAVQGGTLDASTSQVPQDRGGGTSEPSRSLELTFGAQQPAANPPTPDLSLMQDLSGAMGSPLLEQEEVPAVSHPPVYLRSELRGLASSLNPLPLLMSTVRKVVAAATPAQDSLYRVEPSGPQRSSFDERTAAAASTPCTATPTTDAAPSADVATEPLCGMSAGPGPSVSGGSVPFLSARTQQTANSRQLALLPEAGELTLLPGNFVRHVVVRDRCLGCRLEFDGAALHEGGCCGPCHGMEVSGRMLIAGGRPYMKCVACGNLTVVSGDPALVPLCCNACKQGVLRDESTPGGSVSL
jgi:hypothetical protein